MQDLPQPLWGLRSLVIWGWDGGGGGLNPIALIIPHFKIISEVPDAYGQEENVLHFIQHLRNAQSDETSLPLSPDANCVQAGQVPDFPPEPCHCACPHLLLHLVTRLAQPLWLQGSSPLIQSSESRSSAPTTAFLGFSGPRGGNSVVSVSPQALSSSIQWTDKYWVPCVGPGTSNIAMNQMATISCSCGASV